MEEVCVIIAYLHISFPNDFINEVYINITIAVSALLLCITYTIWIHSFKVTYISTLFIELIIQGVSQPRIREIRAWLSKLYRLILRRIILIFNEVLSGSHLGPHHQGSDHHHHCIPDDGNWDGPQNVGFIQTLDAAQEDFSEFSHCKGSRS